MIYDEYLDQLQQGNDEYIRQLENAAIGSVAKMNDEAEKDVRERYEEDAGSNDETKEDAS